MSADRSYLAVREAAGAVTAEDLAAMRRLERQRFAAAHGRESVDPHDALTAVCTARDVDATTTETWTALRSELEETDHEPE